MQEGCEPVGGEPCTALVPTEMAAATTPPAPHADRPASQASKRETSAQDIATLLPIKEFTQEQSAKGSYSCYIQPYIQVAIDNGWTSYLHPEAMHAAFSFKNISRKMK
jgi:hypothetical protein